MYPQQKQRYQYSLSSLPSSLVHIAIFQLLSFLLFIATPCSSAEISLNAPLAEQGGPFVARAGKKFSWTISNTTFSCSEPLTYTASGLRDWLLFDPDALAFSGTPPNNTIDNFQVTLTAHSKTDSESTKVVIRVTNLPPPSLNKPISSQFSFGKGDNKLKGSAQELEDHPPEYPPMYSVFPILENSALKADRPAVRIPNGWSFSIGFLGDTFVSNDSTSDTNFGDDDDGPKYRVLQTDGSPCPPWMVFNREDITLDGVAPKREKLDADPLRINLLLIAQDSQGLGAAVNEPFDVVVADHELSTSREALPTINVTQGTQFKIALNSPNDFEGVLVDGRPIQVFDIGKLMLDLGNSKSWLSYDEGTRTLSGIPPNFSSTSESILSASLTTLFNQTIQTNISLNIVPSFFASNNLSIEVVEGDMVTFDLSKSYSPVATTTWSDGDQSNILLTAAFTCNGTLTPVTNTGLQFDSASGKLGGSMMGDCGRAGGITSITFTAYSKLTHSTSHTILDISIVDRTSRMRRGAFSGVAHKKLVLGLIIAFSVVGGLLAMMCFLAVFRRLARVKDTAVDGEHGWTESEKKWYGLGLDRFYGGAGVGHSQNPLAQGHPGYGWTTDDPNDPNQYSRNAVNSSHGYSPQGQGGMSIPSNFNISSLGLGLRRAGSQSLSALAGRTPNSSPIASKSSPMSPAVMKKSEFMSKIRRTIRRVSDHTTSLRRKRIERPVVSKPVLVSFGPSGGTLGRNASFDEGLPLGYGSHPLGHDGPAIGSNAGSTIMTSSPSASTGERSIPRRRADFGVTPQIPDPETIPNFPAAVGHVHFRDDQVKRAEFTRQSSAGSFGSRSSLGKTHTKDHGNVNNDSGVIDSGVGTGLPISLLNASIRSGLSQQSASILSEPTPIPSTTRPRLVPFTSATRVPVPSISPSTAQSTTLASLPASQQDRYHQNRESGGGDVSGVGFTTRAFAFGLAQRIASQTAKIIKPISAAHTSTRDPTQGQNPRYGSSSPEFRLSGSVDELTMGLHYVQTFGADSAPKFSYSSPNQPHHYPGPPSIFPVTGLDLGNFNFNKSPSTPTVSTATHVRSSFSSLESSHRGGMVIGGGGWKAFGGEVTGDNRAGTADEWETVSMRAIVRAGEKFKFRVPLVNVNAPSPQVTVSHNGVGGVGSELGNVYAMGSKGDFDAKKAGAAFVSPTSENDGTTGTILKIYAFQI